MDMRLPASLMQKYMLKAAEFYIGYVARGPSADVQIQGMSVLDCCRFCFFIVSSCVTIVITQNFLSCVCHHRHDMTFFSLHIFLLSASQDGGSLKSPSVSRGSQRYVIDGLSEKSSVVAEPWERLLDILTVVGARCEWQGDKGQR